MLIEREILRADPDQQKSPETAKSATDYTTARKTSLNCQTNNVSSMSSLVNHCECGICGIPWWNHRM